MDTFKENTIISETPDKWVLVKICNEREGVENPAYYKVFASWAGGYLNGDSWKMNSGISRIEEDLSYYYFYGHSGSCYKCSKTGYGVMTSYSQSVLDSIIEKGNAEVGIDVIALSEVDATEYLNSYC